MPHREKWWWLGIVVQCIVISSAVLGAGMWFVKQHDSALGDTFAKRTELQAVESRVRGLEADQTAQNMVLTNLVHGVEMHLMSLDMQVSNVIQLLNDRRVKLSGGRDF